jgi:Alw26I/Eco31I/Esp3I family type II restriction m6 adenine DNA methyltransferase
MALSANEYNIWKKMKSFPTIGQLDYIVNRRGELDISLNKDAITTNKTKYLFARGRNIGYYQMIKTKVTEYAKQSFVDSTTKREFIKEERLVCQQIVNMAKKRRVSFTIVPKNVVLGNSCNFISLKDNDDNIDLYFLLGILNSSLIDWYFKLTSSNNHINNYEIDTFPIPIKYNNKAEIVELVKKYLTSFDDEILRKIDVLVYEAYGIRKTTSKVLNTISQDVKDSSSIVHNTSGICNQFYKDISQVIPQISIDDCKLMYHCKEIKTFQNLIKRY